MGGVLWQQVDQASVTRGVAEFSAGKGLMDSPPIPDGRSPATEPEGHDEAISLTAWLKPFWSFARHSGLKMAELPSLTEFEYSLQAAAAVEPPPPPPPLVASTAA